MVADWLFKDNLQAFLTVLSWLASYDIAPDELAVIEDGVRGTDADKNQWYDFEFAGKKRVKFSLAIDPGTSVVHVRLDAPADLVPRCRGGVLARMAADPRRVLPAGELLRP